MIRDGVVCTKIKKMLSSQRAHVMLSPKTSYVPKTAYLAQNNEMKSLHLRAPTSYCLPLLTWSNPLMLITKRNIYNLLKDNVSLNLMHYNGYKKWKRMGKNHMIA